MKIADFGLARGVHHIDYYKKTSNVREAGQGWQGECGGYQDLWNSTSVSPPLPFRAACLSSGWHPRPYLTESTHTRVTCESWRLRVWNICHQSLSYPTKKAKQSPKVTQP